MKQEDQDLVRAIVRDIVREEIALAMEKGVPEHHHPPLGTEPKQEPADG